MAFGIRIKNTANTILIDQTYSNHALVQKGTISSGWTSYSGYDPTWHKTLSFTGMKWPILALQCADTPVAALKSLNLSSGAATFEVLFNSSAYGGTNPTVNWYLFDDVSTLAEPVGGWGLRVRNPTTGKIVFHSSFGYLDMVDQTASLAASTSYEAGRKFATIVTRQDMTAGVLFSGSNQLLTYIGHGLRVVDNVVSQGTINIKTYPPGFPLQTFSNPGVFSIVDVTAL